MTDKIEGGCLCGQIRFEAQQINPAAINCHCSICRRQAGAPFMSFVAAPLDDFAYNSGTDLIHRFCSSASFYRTFCGNCGSPLPIVDEGHNKIYIPATNLDDQTKVTIGAHMFVGSKTHWHAIGDDAAQFEEFPQ